MGLFVPRFFSEIFADMVSVLLQRSGVTDLNYGSVFTLLLEAAATEDDEQYFQMIEVIRGYQLDKTTGDDLDNRATEYGLERLTAQAASTYVVFGDSSFEKISTVVYSGLSGELAGSQSINASSDADFPAAGSIIIGRGTPRVETIQYWSITNNTNYYTFNLGTSISSPSSLAYDHGTDETIILSQGGNRTITAGTEVKVPASDTLEEISYSLDEEVILSDGEVESEEAAVTATESGSKGNVPIGSIREFSSVDPFTGATVTNSYRVTNGTDEESDPELRDRIRDTVQSLSRGTPRSIISGIIGETSGNKRVVSASLRDATLPTDVVKVFIDDGAGFIATFDHVGFEILLEAAVGGERYLTVSNTPLIKAFAETKFAEPYAITDGMVLTYHVGGTTETITFSDDDFATADSALAQEVVVKINGSSELVEARLTGDSDTLKIFARSDDADDIQISSSGANTALQFPTDKKETIKLFRLRDGSISLLGKGSTSSVESVEDAPFTLTSGTVLCIVTDGAETNIEKVWFLNAALSSAAAIADYMDARVSGCTVYDSLNKIVIKSKTENSSESSVRILDMFDNVYNAGATGTTDETTMNLFAANGDYLHVGLDSPFDVIYYKSDNGTPPSSSILPTFEYSISGPAWETLGVTDTTDGFISTGYMTFQPPTDWIATSYLGVTKYWVRIRRTESGAITNMSTGYVKISSANEVFDFPTTMSSGSDKDYSLNRFLGQIKFEEQLQAGDAIVAGLDNDGTYESTAFVSSPAIAGVTGITGQTLTYVDSGITGTVLFESSDFASSVASASEIAVAINSKAAGSYSSESDTIIRFGTSRINNGSFRVVSGGANLLLGFPTTEVENLVSHQPAAESGATGDMSFDVDDSLVVLIDDDEEGLTIPCYHEGTVESSTSTTLVDSSLGDTFESDTEVVGYDVEMTSGLYEGVRKEVISYDHTTGTMGVTGAYASISAVEAAITIPATGVADLELTAQTAGETGNYITVEVRAGNAGYQVITISNGVTGEVYDTEQSYGGTTGDIVTGILSGSLCTATGAAVYTNEMSVDDYTLTGGSEAATSPAADDTFQILPSSTSLLVDFWNNRLVSAEINLLLDKAEIVILSNEAIQIASINSGEESSVFVTGGSANTKLLFSTERVIGVDAYRHFTGLAREVQWLIDGKIDDPDNYPGLRAAGVQVEVVEPVMIPVTASIAVTPDDGFSMSTLINDIKSAVSNYINKLDVGDDVILSSIIVAVRNVTGVFDVEVEYINDDASNLTISDDQLARITDDDILIKGA